MQQPKPARRGRGWGLTEEHVSGPSTVWQQMEPTAGCRARRTRLSEGGHFRGDAAVACSWRGAGEAEEHGTRASERATGPASRDGPARMLLRRPTHQTTSRKETDARQRCWEEQGGGSDVLGAWGRSHVWRTDLEPRGQQQDSRPEPSRAPCDHSP